MRRLSVLVFVFTALISGLFVVMASSGCSDGSGGSQGSVISINNPFVQEGDSGTTSITFDVIVTPDPGVDVTVEWTTVDGTAENENGDGDYVSLSGTLVISTGSTEGPMMGTITIIVNGDTVIEPDETFQVVLSHPVFAVVANAVGTATIINDDGGIRVDPTATGTPDGLTWATAFHTVQEAVTVAEAGGFDVWVAKGSYTNGGGHEPVVTMAKGTNIYGGFEGYASGSGAQETDVSQRDASANETILDGGDTAWHVVSAITGSTLSGFTIRSGSATGVGGASSDIEGGGVYIQYDYTGGSEPFVLDDCRIEQCYADLRGGGLFAGESVIITNCVFDQNTSKFEGGAIYINGADAVITGTEFNRNASANNKAGAVFVRSGGSQTISQCIFTGNSAGGYESGGAVYSESNGLTMDRCTFSANRSNSGGGLYVSASSPTVRNCIFTDNRAVFGGAVMCNGNTSTIRPVFINCTSSGNSSDYEGSGAYIASSAAPSFINSVFWGDASALGSEEIYAESGVTLSFTYCDVQWSGGSTSWSSTFGDGAGIDGGGNMDDDPLFVNVPVRIDFTYNTGTQNTMHVLNASSNFVTGDVIEIEYDDVVRTVTAVVGDDISFTPNLSTTVTAKMRVENWGAGATDIVTDVHLQGGSPCIDNGDPASTSTDAIDGTSRPQGSGYDIGAYEQ